MTISQIIDNSSLPRMEAEILLAFVLKKNREYLLTHPETLVNVPAGKIFSFLEKKRLKNWPIAYLIGHKEFYGLDFKVNKNVLVPRPETEMMVEEIVKMSKEIKRPLIIDLGTGSGAIIIAVAKELRRLDKAKYHQSDFVGIDISASALKTAKSNASLYKLTKKIKFHCGNLLTPIAKQISKRVLIVAANLPYLTPAQTTKEPSISHEPQLALDGGSDGLKYYREMFLQLTRAKHQSFTLFCEINPAQTHKMKALAKKRWPMANIRIKKDLARKNRLVIITLKNS